MVVNKAERVTDVSLEIDDGTGRIDCTKWVNESADLKEMEGIMDGMYVCVHGHLKGFQGKKQLVIFCISSLRASQCVEAAEQLGAERDHLASVVGSAVNVWSAGDIMTLTAAAATAAVIPVEKGMNISGNEGSNNSSNGSFSGELLPEENFLGICSRELLARGCELLKRTRKGDINRVGRVMLKMKSRHVAGTITKKKKNMVLEVIKEMPAWPGRHLLDGGEYRRYFALKTVLRGVVEFECRNQREYDIWTQGVSRLRI